MKKALKVSRIRPNDDIKVGVSVFVWEGAE
jgi:hypothetical protein